MTREQGVWRDDDDPTPGGDIHRQQRLRRDRSSRCSDKCSHLLNARALETMVECHVITTASPTLLR
jgi:hypothetical protein